MSDAVEARERESILRDLESADEDVRRLAVERAGVLGAESTALLVTRLGDASWRVRKAAVERLVAGVDSGAVVAALVTALGDGENSGRRNAACMHSCTAARSRRRLQRALRSPERGRVSSKMRSSSRSSPPR